MSTAIGLVLGAGGARGLAHIGALRALEESRLELAAVAGTSIGGLVGAMAAAGHRSGHIGALASRRTRWRLPKLSRKGGVIDQRRLIEGFCDDLPANIEDLPMPYAAMAVDIDRGEPVVLDHGPLKRALTATVAVPGFLSPVDLAGRHLVDGAAVNALPVDVIRSLTDAPVVAVDVLSPKDRPLDFGETSLAIKRFWARLTLQRRPLALDVFLKAFSIQQSLLNEQRLARYPPALYVRPELPHDIRLEGFDRLDEAAECGYRAMQQALRKAPF